MKLLMYSVFMLLIAPCNGSKKAAGTVPDNSKAEIIFRTSACFGKCPIYTLTISGETKTATFIGEKDTEKIGVYTRSLSAKELEGFVEAFEKADFNSMEEEYPGMITDFPFKYITYTNNGKTKKVKSRSGAPKALTDLEKMLSDYANSEGWKKTEGSSNTSD